VARSGSGVGPDGRGAQRHQGVGPAGVGVRLVLLAGHDGDLGRQAFEGRDHHRAFGRGELHLHPEPPTLVVVPEGERPRSLDVASLLGRAPHLEIGHPPHTGRRHALRPRDQIALGRGRREPRQLDDLVHAEVPARERVAHTGQGLQGVGGRDPPMGLPLGDPVPHGQPVREVASAAPAPDLVAIRAGDQLEQVTLRGADARVRDVELLNR
jgi:hypothetical protein